MLRVFLLEGGSLSSHAIQCSDVEEMVQPNK